MPDTRTLSAGETIQTRRGPITTTQLVKYAGASGDFHRIHFDQAFATESGLGGLLAHGMLTMGFAASCLSDVLGPAVRLSDIAARFVEPVRVGDIIESIATVREIGADGALHLDYESRVGTRVVLKGQGTAHYLTKVA